MQENNPEVSIVEQVRLIKHQSYTRVGIILTSLMLVAFIYGLLCPPIVTNIYADSNTDAVVTEAGVNVGSMISIALDPSIDIDVMPSSDTVYDKKAAKLTVTTNNSSGYSLYMQTLDDTANLTSDDLSNTTTIAPLAKASILEQFETNTWGYNLGRSGSIDKDRIYYPVPTTSTTVMETGGTSYRDEYDLTFGVAVSNNLPVGRYSNSVMISAVANPTVITSLNQAQYMQTMNKELCQNTDYGVTKQLIDMRDGKKYWVARLLDGNCWMTQNLALTLKDFGDGNGIHAMTENGDMGSKLTSDNTDLPLKVVNGATQSTAWDESSEYPPTETYKLLSTGTNAHTGTESWDLGKYVLATPWLSTPCADQASTLEDCSAYGLVDISDTSKFTPGYEATIGDWNGATVTSNTLVTVNCAEWSGEGTKKICVAGSYDEHYSLGNYYKFNAATVGTGATTAAGKIVNSSICPKGWKLPLSAAVNDNASGSYYHLLDKYGLATKISSDLNYNIASEPLYFVRGGYVIGGGAITLFGSTGEYWSSVVAVSGAYYSLYFSTSTVTSYYSGGNYANGQYAPTVRCAIY